MSQENVELVRRAYAEWERGNMMAGVDLFDSEIVFESFVPGSKTGTVAHGAAEVEAFMREFLAQWRDYRLVGEDFRAAGQDKVLVIGRQTARGRQSGAEVEDQLFSVWTFRAKKVVRLRFTPFRAEALEAAGLRE